MLSEQDNHRILTFGDFILDLDRGALRRNDSDIELRRQSFEVLRILLENHGHLVAKNDLQLAVWGGVAVTDDSLTHCILDIRKAIGDSDKTVVRTVPRRGYLFDLPVTDTRSAEINTRPKTNFAIRAATAVVLLLAVGWWLGNAVSIDVEPSDTAVNAPPDNSIAVLPFVDLSDGQNQKYFGEALAEEVLNQLAKVPALRVIARTSSFSFRNSESNIKSIAQTLKVAYILEGSIRKSGDQTRITAQLIHANDGSHIWSQTYDRYSANVLDIQTDVASAVASSLQVSLAGPSSPEHDTDPVTYGLFARAHFLLHQTDPGLKPGAAALLEKVVERDPEFLRGMTELGRAYLQLSKTGQLPREVGQRMADDLTRRVLAIDPNDAVANAWRGWRELFDNNDVAASVSRFRRALEADPRNLDILRPATVAITTLGQIDEAIALGEYVLAHDPLCEICRNNLITAYRVAGRHDLSEEQIRMALTVDPERSGLYQSLAYTLLLKGDPEGAITALSRDHNETWFRLVCTAIALHQLARFPEFELALADLIKEWGDIEPAAVALTYAAIEDADAAFHWLAKASVKREMDMIYYKSPFYDSIHDDPRWDQMLATIGMSEQQLAALNFRVSVPL